MSYCEVAARDELHRAFHDLEHGYPITGDDELFERLLLEINQAGLSWSTVLRKRDAFRRAYAGFDVDRVARFGIRDRERLMQDAGIIRNRLKIDAAIENARRIRALRKEYGSFAGWLNAHHPRENKEWVKLFKRTFLFTGGEITNEFLKGTGYLAGAHVPECPVYARIARLRPPWMSA